MPERRRGIVKSFQHMGAIPTIEERQNELLEEFSIFTDWLDRYQQLIDLGQSLPTPSQGLHADKNLIRGCQSRVWIDGQERDGKLYFEADSDAVITKGIAALLLEVFNGHSPREVAEANLFLLDRLGLAEHLSPTRANGLLAMVDHIRAFAKERE